MTMTDPVADMLTRLRNANSAHHDSVSLPSSKLKTNIAEILKQEGYISSWEVSDARVGQTLTLPLQYGHLHETGVGIEPEPRAVDRRHQARLEAGSACLRTLDRDPHGPRWPGCRDPVHLLRSSHRPSGRAEGRGWGSPRLRVVI